MAKSPKSKTKQTKADQGDDVDMKGSKELEEDEVSEEEGEVFVVERLKAAQFGRIKAGAWAYHVVWEGYDVPKEWTWEPVENLEGCPEILDAFWADQPISRDDKVEKGHKLTFPPKPTTSRRKSTLTLAPPSSTTKKRGRASAASVKKDDEEDDTEEEGQKRGRGRPSKASKKDDSETEDDKVEEKKSKSEPKRSSRASTDGKGKGKEIAATKGRKSAASAAEEDEVDGDLAPEAEEEDLIVEDKMDEDKGDDDASSASAKRAATDKSKAKPRTSKATRSISPPITAPSSTKAKSTSNGKSTAKPHPITKNSSTAKSGFEAVDLAKGDMAAHMDAGVDWEELAKCVETVEKMKDDEAEDVMDDKDRLWVFLMLKDGSQHKVRLTSAKSRCPLALIDFFVDHLRWKSKPRD